MPEIPMHTSIGMQVQQRRAKEAQRCADEFYISGATGVWYCSGMYNSKECSVQ